MFEQHRLAVGSHREIVERRRGERQIEAGRALWIGRAQAEICNDANDFEGSLLWIRVGNRDQGPSILVTLQNQPSSQRNGAAKKAFDESVVDHGDLRRPWCEIPVAKQSPAQS